MLLLIRIANLENDIIEYEAKKDVYEKAKEDGSEEIVELHIEYLQQNRDYIVLQNKYNNALEAYNAEMLSLQEMENLATEFNESDMQVVTKAVAAPGPSAPDKAQNLIIAAVIGVVLGVLVVLFKTFIQNEKKRQDS